MPVDLMTRLRSGPPEAVALDLLYGGQAGNDGYYDATPSLHSRQSSVTAVSRTSSTEMASSPASVTTGPPSSGSRIGRPPQWTVSRSRKLARLYLYSTLPVEKILKVLEGDNFHPRKNSAQKTIHKMLDNDPRYLRPESRMEMSKRIGSLAMSSTRRRRNKRVPREIAGLIRGSIEADETIRTPEVTSPSGQSARVEDTPCFDFTASPEIPSLNYFSFPFRSQGDDRTGVHDTREEPYLDVIRDMKRRVSDCSTNFAFQLSTLIKEFTISICSDNDRSPGRRPSVTLSECSLPDEPIDVEELPAVYEAFPDPGFALPGDFLTAHTRSCADFPGQQHGNGDCWCSISREASATEGSWLLPTGQLSERARFILEHPSPANLSLQDSFGNTPLHLFAALNGYQDLLLGLVFKSGIQCLRAANTGGQTFLHVLHLEWFADLGNPSTSLKRLLTYVRDVCPDLVYEIDLYGRTFLHRAHSLIRNPAALAELVSLFNPMLASRRDAFGFSPVSDGDPASHSPYIPPRRTGSLSPLIEGLSRTNSPRPQSSDEGLFLAYHARLVQVIHSSYTNPTVEDAEGRNGLHCLAEAILNQQTMDRHVQSSQRGSASSVAGGRPHLKRKLDSSTSSIKDSMSSTPPYSALTSSPPPSVGSGPLAAQEGTLPTRLRHLQSLLLPSIGVSAAHYDRHGNTPLMAFIEHIPDDHDDKSRTLQAILETLILRGGAATSPSSTTTTTTTPITSPNPNTSSTTTIAPTVTSTYPPPPTPRPNLPIPILESRNRRGETPLLVAARLGRKVALATLLECGANPRARDADGRGVLEVLDSEVTSARARADVCLYARLEACRVLVTGRREWGVGYVGGYQGRKGGGDNGREGGRGGEGAVVSEWRVREGGGRRAL